MEGNKEKKRHMNFIIDFVIKIFYKSLCIDDEPLHIRLRKGYLALITVLSIATMAIAWFRSSTSTMSGVARYVFIASRVGSGGSCICLWLYVRVTKSFEDRICSCWLTVISLNLTMGALTDSKSPNFQNQMMVGGVIIFSRLHWFTYVPPFIGAVVNLLNLWTDGYLSLPGASDKNEPWWSLATVPLLCAFLWGLTYVNMEYSALFDSMQATVTMTQKVTERLAQYDIEAARGALTATPTEAKERSEAIAIRSSFCKMIKNLELYRPHLPPYVLYYQNAATASPAEDGSRRSPEENPSPSVHNLPVGTSTVVPTEPPTFLSLTHLSSSDEARDSSSSDAKSAQSKSNGSLELSGIFAVSRTVQPNGPRTLPIVVVLVDCSKAMNSALQYSSAAVSRRINVIVEKMHLTSSFFNGTFHSLMGNIALVTWNAVGKPIQQPELQAARFLFSVADTYGTGVLHMGTARCQIAGTTHKTLTVYGDWIESTYRMLLLAVRHGATLVSEEVAEVLPWETRGVDAIPGPNNHGAMKLYEILLPPPELMYVDVYAHSIPRSPYSTVVCRALESCINGHYADALQVLGSIMNADKSPSIRHLFEKARLCQRLSIPSGEFAWVQVRSPEPLTTISS